MIKLGDSVLLYHVTNDADTVKAFVSDETNTELDISPVHLKKKSNGVFSSSIKMPYCDYLSVEYISYKDGIEIEFRKSRVEFDMVSTIVSEL